MQAKRRRIRRSRHAEAGEFLWLISFSDFLMLLFIFFVALFSLTHNKLKKSDYQRIVATLRGTRQPENKIKTLSKEVEDWVAKSKLSEQMIVEKDADSLKLQVRSQLLFDSGQFALRTEGKEKLAALSVILAQVPEPYRLGIEGHTDDTPIPAPDGGIDGNWELSSKRALAVFQALNLQASLQKRVVLLAFGDTSPIVPNRTENGVPIAENQAKNRRVTIRIFQD